MAEEVKTEAKKENAGKMMATAFKFILGLAFLAFGAWLVYRGWGYLLNLIKGSVGLFFILAGIITLAIAKE
jgi:amino acid transporter